MKLLFVFLSFVFFSAPAQDFSLEDIWTKNTFQMKSFDGYKWSKIPGAVYKIENNELVLWNIITEKKIKSVCKTEDWKYDSYTIVADEYTFSANESKILIQTETEAIYRHSTKAIFYVYDIKKNKLEPVADSSKLTSCTFSPDEKKLAYSFDNNLYIKDLQTNISNQITTDGRLNYIINGTSDWVYEEEFEMVKCYDWSVDSKKIAFVRFDESAVKEYNMQVWQSNLYPTNYSFKYPKAGETNAEVSVLIYRLDTKKTNLLYDGKGKNSYVPRLKWTNKPNTLSLIHINRNQDSLLLRFYNSETYASETILQQASKTYVEIDNDLHFLEKSDEIVFKSHTGFRNIMKLNLKTKNQVQITNFQKEEVQEIIAIDEEKKRIFFSAKDSPPFNKYVYAIDYDGNNLKRIISSQGVNTAEIDPTFAYILCTNSTMEKGISYGLFNRKGTKIKEIEKNDAFKNTLINMHFLAPLFKSFNIIDSSSISKSLDLNYYLIKPKDFDSTKKYPVLVYFYGGPGSQEVINEWQGKNYLWFQYLAQKGFIIACCDNRGTGGRGADFQHCTTNRLGELETKDQIAFGKFLKTLPFVEKSKIATFGWSFGGYLSALCLLLGADVFSAAIAVAPVTNWRLYDTIYTERYLKNPIDNAKGYDDYSPLSHANKLKGRFLLVHGTGDDNVHFQNTIEIQRALQNEGKHFETIFYPDKNHGIGGAKTRLHLYQKMTDFLLELKK